MITEVLALPDFLSGNLQNFILGVLTLVTGGSIVQLIIFLVKRRSELKSLDTGSDSVALKSANDYIQTLSDDIKELRVEIVSIKRERSDELAAARESLVGAERQVGRLSSELARVRADLAVAQAQIFELSRRYQAPPGDARR